MSTEEPTQVPPTEHSELSPPPELPQTQDTEQPQQSAEAPSTETATPPETAEGEQTAENPEGQDIIPALAAEGGREVSHKILYVGGLTKTVTEEELRQLFESAGPVQTVKILFDKNRPGFHYAFVEFEEDRDANAAFDALNGTLVHGSEIRINWAYQSQQAKNNPDAFNVFVGDLSAEINDEKLRAAFSKFPSLLQAHVMWDMQTGRSRSYGFVSFQDQKDADEAIATMNGEYLSGRAIRLNWASHKQQTHGHGHHGHHSHHHGHHNGNGLHNGNLNHSGHYYHHHRHNNNHHNNNNSYNGSYPQNPMTTGSSGSPVTPGTPLGNGVPLNGVPINGSNGMNLLAPPSFEAVLRKSPSWQTTVYVGNLAHFTTQNDLIPYLQNYGFIVDLKFYPDKGCAFVKYDSHERAAVAIVNLTGAIINGRALKLGWGKERAPTSVPYQNYGPMVYTQ